MPIHSLIIHSFSTHSCLLGTVAGTVAGTWGGATKQKALFPWAPTLSGRVEMGRKGCLGWWELWREAVSMERR